MRTCILLLMAGLLSIAQACNGGTGTTDPTDNDPHSDKGPAQKDLAGLSKAYFASGCFWCVEEVFESVRGVEEAISGYSGGTEPAPTYEEVSKGATGHAEAIEVHYDPASVSYETLVKVFFASHDPTTPDRQGPDAGRQYRSIAFYRTPEEKAIISDQIDRLNASGKFDRPIVTEVVPFVKFWPAEEYHQDYVRHHPTDGYVRNVSIPRFERFKRTMPEVLK